MNIEYEKHIQDFILFRVEVYLYLLNVIKFVYNDTM